MGASRAGQILAALTLASAAAAAQDITADGVARAVSQNYYLRIYCMDYFPLNIAIAEKVTEDTIKFGSAQFGDETLRLEVVAELARRAKEVKATGPKAWCTTQKTVLTARGMGYLFK